MGPGMEVRDHIDGHPSGYQQCATLLNFSAITAFYTYFKDWNKIQ